MEAEFAKPTEREQGEAHLHFSFSQLNTYLMCPMKYAHSYVWATPWETKPIALVLCLRSGAFCFNRRKGGS
jgi:hypothetical protein